MSCACGLAREFQFSYRLHVRTSGYRSRSGRIPYVHPALCNQNELLASNMNTDPTQDDTLFYLAWKHIGPQPHETRNRTIWRRTSSLRNPPVFKEAFQLRSLSPVYLWSPGTLRPTTSVDRQHLRPYKVSSVYWCPDHGTYLTVPYDCTTENVHDRARNDELDNWERLKFGHGAINGRCVSVLGHRYGSDVLAAGGPANWMPELIPSIHNRYESPAIPGARGPSYLTGDISILMGLAALSTTPERVVPTIATSFRPEGTTTWRPHRRFADASKIPAIRTQISHD